MSVFKDNKKSLLLSTAIKAENNRCSVMYKYGLIIRLMIPYVYNQGLERKEWHYPEDELVE